MITIASLKSYSLKDLAQLAKKQGVAGWHSMKKDQLIRSLERLTKTRAPKVVSPPAAKVAKNSEARKPARVKTSVSKTVASTSVARPAVNGHAPKRVVPPPKSKSTPQVVKRIQKINEARDQKRDLSLAPIFVANGDKNGVVATTPKRDRIVLLVRDCYWLHAYWEVTRQSVLRAQSALAAYWHTAKPVLRLMEVEVSGTTSSSERIAREISVHGGVRNWYIEVPNPPKSLRVDLGYLASNGKFYTLCRSNTVTTPKPGASDAVDENWADVAENYEKIFAQSGGYSEENNSNELQELFEERLRRPMHSPNATRFGVGAESVLKRKRDFQFEVDAEMVVFGSTKPDAHLMLAGEPVKLGADGSFRIRMNLPDKRQVIPIVASSKDGVEQRTIVLAVERNTKVMEPIVKEKAASSTATDD